MRHPYDRLVPVNDMTRALGIGPRLDQLEARVTTLVNSLPSKIDEYLSTRKFVIKPDGELDEEGLDD